MAHEADELLKSLKLTREHLREAGHLDSQKKKQEEQVLEGRKWCVFVDASVVSQKTFDCAISFLHIQNGKGWKDDLVTVHAYHPPEDSKKPVHLQGAHVLKTYETQLIKARREYEHEMKHSLQASVLLRTSGTGVIEGLDSTRTPAGGRHPNVDTLIEVANNEVKADWVLLGFHQSKEGQFGATADYVVKLVNANVVCIKHWRPLPKKDEEMVFVVGVDGSQAALRGLSEVLAIARPGVDKVHAIVVSKHEGAKDRETLDAVKALVDAHTPPIPVEAAWRCLDKSARNAAELMCHVSEELGADFLVIASRSTTNSSRPEHRERLNELGSTALFCTMHSKCHNMIIKTTETEFVSSPVTKSPVSKMRTY
mmetsp:Transcript_3715/g.8981  ORF Transcript_3715/g.8981 Transcript_3715/m.8981 type:complete len:368 (-) Transcript_3715:417-1520(-)